MPSYTPIEQVEEVDALRSQVDILRAILDEAGDHLELDTYEFVTEWIKHNLHQASELERAAGFSGVVIPA